MRTSSRQRAWALSDPRLSSPARMRQKCCYGQKNFGSICGSLSPSPTHLSHTRNINPFENKVWEVYIFIKKCSFVHWSRHYVSAYICMYMCIEYSDASSNRVRTHAALNSNSRWLHRLKSFWYQRKKKMNLVKNNNKICLMRMWIVGCSEHLFSLLNCLWTRKEIM